MHPTPMPSQPISSSSPCSRIVRRTIACLLGVSLSASSLAAVEHSALYGADGAAWSPSGRLPDFSYAGYRRGEAPLPTVPAVADVRSFGAIGDGVADDTQAFLDAIAATDSGAILVPAGRYRITRVLRITKPNVVLRGAGPTRSVLWFPTHLSDIEPDWTETADGDFASRYSWSGGFVRMEGSFRQSDLAQVTVPASRGDRWLSVSTTSGLTVGRTVEVRLQDNGDHSLTSHLYSGDPGSVTHIGDVEIDLTARIAEVSNGRIRLDRPLPWDVALAWSPTVRSWNPSVSECGIEGLGFEFPAVRYPGHHEELGYNGIAMINVANCWVRDVKFINADSCIFPSGRFCTIAGVVIDAYYGRGSSAAGHHGIHLKKASDNLVTGVDSRVKFLHELSVERCWLNVYSGCRGLDLAFDHHVRFPYANLYTDIDVGAGSRIWSSGGGRDRGRHSGAFATFWNIRAARSLPYPPSGWGPWSINLVGLTTVATESTVPDGKWFETMAPGHLSPPDLRIAQLARRLGRTPPVNRAPTVGLTSPAAGSAGAAPARLSLAANANDGDGWVSEVSFYAGTTLLGRDSTAPYSYAWSGIADGTYSITAQARDDQGAVTVSAPVLVTVGSSSSGGNAPYGATAQRIPGRIEAEHYDHGGEGVAYHDTGAGNQGGALRSDGVDVEADPASSGGHHLAYVADGEWLEYTVQVAESGTYALAVRTASASSATPGAVTASIDGAQVGGTIVLPRTGGWRSFATTRLEGIALTAGTHVLRLTIPDGGSNLDFIEFSRMTSPQPSFGARVNFQPVTAPTVSGWQVDAGGTFAARSGGLSYGWINGENSTARDRNAASSPDQLHDTLIHLQKAAGQAWEIAVPAGRYQVRLLCGDPSYIDQVNTVRIESVIATDPDGGDHFDQHEVEVEVSDGRLTITSASGGNNAKLCAIEIIQIPLSGG